ncbi:hypothetical protein HY469_02055 [Candidatus Roizmanbacteria bacterium]|nr:hypothetical protein [Candidatus Roizmanbacteria bacterium]
MTTKSRFQTIQIRFQVNVNLAGFQRYAMFVAVAIIVELVSLLGLFMLRGHFLVFWINSVITPVGIVVGYFAHRYITWRDRPGNWRWTIGGYVPVAVALWMLELVFWQLWRRTGVLACPLYSFMVQMSDRHVPSVDLYLFHGLLQCSWLSLALLSLTVSLTIGFWLFNKYSFPEN